MELGILLQVSTIMRHDGNATEHVCISVETSLQWTPVYNALLFSFANTAAEEL